ncbi:MAG: polyphosphate polymerase domain-containing protein [Nannocystaceae bacterium]|nr:polyphosphate polymerase domain-containing protein [Nannocystaceae bacterium]
MGGFSPSVITRREYKFLIDRATADEVRAAVSPFCDIDPHAADLPGQKYTIDTLYLDNEHLSLFWANDLEQLDRIKLRVRDYADARSSAVYFEVKRRINDTILKSRGRVPRELWERLLSDDTAEIPEDCIEGDRLAVEKFLFYARTMHVKPFTLVQYKREPYFSTIDDYARVTFDTHIRAHSVESFGFNPDGGAWRALDDAISQGTQDSMVVLELKFTNMVPLWMVNITRSLGLARRAFSKYGNSIRAFYDFGDSRTLRGRFS